MEKRREDVKCSMCGTPWLINEQTGICVTCEMEHLLDEEEDEPMYALEQYGEDDSPEAWEGVDG